MRKISIYAAMAVLAAVVATGCGSSKQVTSPTSVTDSKAMKKNLGAAAEVEVTFPCSEGGDSDLEHLRCGGIGKSKDRKMAKDRAYQDALAQLSSKLAGVASAARDGVAVSSNADGEDFHDKVVTKAKEISQANIAGYRTACEKFTVNQQDNSYNCYVTIEFGKQKVVKQMYEKLSADKLLKADYDFDRYMKEFDEDLKEYEQKHK
ncbi:hypothetical protein FACS1894199_15420 [Bacteroidia bacterium]|nr:hypothetical protein FACS1894199_15420 [Bacteroidia bacterium]